jgi:prophage regulatory protein
MGMENQAVPQLLRISKLSANIGVSRSTIWAWVKAGKFPKPIKLAENTTVWSAADIEAWLKSRILVSQAEGA